MGQRHRRRLAGGGDPHQLRPAGRGRRHPHPAEPVRGQHGGQAALLPAVCDPLHAARRQHRHPLERARPRLLPARCHPHHPRAED
eukprot:4864487-Pyramimonas_sp.AAC.1